MKKSFGNDCYEEQKLIKYTLIIFSASYVLRVTEDLLLYFFRDHLEIYNGSTLHNCIKLVSWTLWDLLPIICLFIIHFNNFNSYRNEEILYCEYSEEGRSSASSYADYLFQDMCSEPNKEDSLFK